MLQWMLRHWLGDELPTAEDYANMSKGAEGDSYVNIPEQRGKCECDSVLEMIAAKAQIRYLWAMEKRKLAQASNCDGICTDKELFERIREELVMKNAWQAAELAAEI